MTGPGVRWSAEIRWMFGVGGTLQCQACIQSKDACGIAVLKAVLEFERMRTESVLEKVLIVEDEVHARTGLTELIESWGYRAECAADGVEGLERAVQWAPSIVVTDLKMPRMDGMELLSRIGELPQRVAVVMLTAQGSIESAVEAMRMGAYDYIPKPVDPVRLKTILQNASRQRERPMWSWRRRGGSCGIRACWGRWWGRRRR